jgi:uncharacterized protein (TIGR03437 family)
MTTTASVLTIDLTDLVAYQGDISDPTQFATVPPPTTPNPVRNYFVATLIGDIVKVNNETVKGTYFGRTRVLSATPNAHLGDGEAIADVTRIAMREHIFEILMPDKTQIGTIMSTGLVAGKAPPGTGAPSDEYGNWAIVGGTGAYLGAGGQVKARTPPAGGAHLASMREDPSYRIGTGLPNTFILHVIPMDPPQIMTTAFGPLVMHGGSTPVTKSNPAVAHRQLFLFATGLGPTNPDVDLAHRFPPNPPFNVNSPLTVTVNGNLATDVSAVGIPGAVNAYRVDFKMPAGVPTGLVPIQVTAAWISGPPAYIWAA